MFFKKLVVVPFADERVFVELFNVVDLFVPHLVLSEGEFGFQRFNLVGQEFIGLGLVCKLLDNISENLFSHKVFLEQMKGLVLFSKTLVLRCEMLDGLLESGDFIFIVRDKKG